jgi:hypothetical protein
VLYEERAVTVDEVGDEDRQAIVLLDGGGESLGALPAWPWLRATGIRRVDSTGSGSSAPP